MQKIVFAVVLLCTSFLYSAGAAELSIYTENLPPLNYLKDGVLVGPSVEIVREIQRRVKSDAQIHVLPWARAYQLALEKENVVLFGTTQTQKREKLFKWVGPLAVKRDILIAKRGSGLTIESLDDAKKVNRIGTLRGDTRDQLLQDYGFENLEPVSDERNNAKKLMMGRIDLWAYKEPGVETVCRLAGLDPDNFVEVYHLREIEVSIAFSLKTSDEIVERWREVFAKMMTDGTLERIRSAWSYE